MGCNTSQEQKSAVTDNNGEVDTNNETTNKSARNSAKSDKASKSAKSEKLTNGHDNKSSAKHDEGMNLCYFLNNEVWATLFTGVHNLLVF